MNEVQLLIGNVSTTIVGKLDRDLYKELKRELGYQPENSIWMSSGNPNWDGWISTICYSEGFCKCPNKKSGMHFPTGLFSKCKTFLQKNGVVVNSFDNRGLKPERTHNFTLEDVALYPYQKEVVSSSIKSGRGIIKMATGAGKTFCAASIIAELGVVPAIFFVTSKDLLKQAYDEFTKKIRLDGSPITVGRVGGGYTDIRDITVMTVQTAIKVCPKWDDALRKYTTAQFVKFDDEDEQDSTNIEPIRNDLLQTLYKCKIFMQDECLTGDSTVIIRGHGKKRLDELGDFVGKEILSFNGISVAWKKINKFIKSGIKCVLKITLNSGETIKCTSNHLIMTERGWVKAGELQKTDQVLFCANVDVEQKCLQKEEAQADSLNTCLDTRSLDIKSLIGKLGLMSYCRTPLCVGAGAENRLSLNIQHLNLLSSVRVVDNTQNMFTVMIKDQKHGILNYLLWNNKQFLEHYWEIPVLHSPQSVVKIPDYVLHMGYVKKIGQTTNHLFFKDSFPIQGLLTIKDLGKNRFATIPHVYHVLMNFIRLPILMVKKKLLQLGLIILDLLDCLGGYVMMEAEPKILFAFTPKDIQNQKYKFVQNGFLETMEKQPYINQKTSILPFVLQKKQERQSTPTYINTYQNACNTNYVGIKNIEMVGKSKVFDITVEDTHCFFANGVLVHNCQHTASESIQVICDTLKNAYYRYGLSATPHRDQNDDILIDGCFGKTIVDINASGLIKNDFLVRPEIAFIPIRNMNMRKRDTYPTVYKEGIVENEFRNRWISNLAQSLVKNGRTVLVLVKQIKHGEIIQSMIPDSVFLHGSCTKKQREQHIEKMRLGHAPVTVASTIFDEGIDVRPLDALILAGAGKSPTRALQRIGRVIRKYTYPDGREKTNAYVYDFWDHLPYLTDHALERLKMYQSEPEFVIKHLDDNL